MIDIKININDKNLEKIKKLKMGIWFSYSGNLIVLRDKGQERIKKIIEAGLMPKTNFKNSIILYAGPSKSEEVVIGPTTSKRMDPYLEQMLNLGVKATIGKGPRNNFINNIIKEHQAPYFVLFSGVSAYLSSFFSNEKVLEFEDLGPEAIRSYSVKELPLFTAIDASGISFW